jgi:hypothetical protein
MAGIVKCWATGAKSNSSKANINIKQQDECMLLLLPQEQAQQCARGVLLRLLLG